MLTWKKKDRHPCHSGHMAKETLQEKEQVPEELEDVSGATAVGYLDHATQWKE